ncbi:MAG: hypothetical protein Q9226_007181 [Calogaya cf. arnoldii]
MDEDFETFVNAGLSRGWERESKDAAARQARRVMEANANANARNAMSLALQEEIEVRDELGTSGSGEAREKEDGANQSGEKIEADKPSLTLGYQDTQAEAGGRPEDTSLDELEALMEGY